MVEVSKNAFAFSISNSVVHTSLSKTDVLFASLCHEATTLFRISQLENKGSHHALEKK